MASQQAAFGSIPLTEALRLREGQTESEAVQAVEDACKVIMDEETRAAASAFAKAKRTLKSTLGVYDEPTRIKIDGLCTIEITSGHRDGYEVDEGTTYRHTVIAE